MELPYIYPESCLSRQWVVAFGDRGGNTAYMVYEVIGWSISRYFLMLLVICKIMAQRKPNIALYVLVDKCLGIPTSYKPISKVIALDEETSKSINRFLEVTVISDSILIEGFSKSKYTTKLLLVGCFVLLKRNLICHV